MALATGLEPVTVRLTVPALTAIGASVTLASDDAAIADFVMWEAELMEDLNPDSVEEMFPIPAPRRTHRIEDPARRPRATI